MLTLMKMPCTTHGWMLALMKYLISTSCLISSINKPTSRWSCVRTYVQDLHMDICSSSSSASLARPILMHACHRHVNEHIYGHPHGVRMDTYSGPWPTSHCWVWRSARVRLMALTSVISSCTSLLTRSRTQDSASRVLRVCQTTPPSIPKPTRQNE